MDPEPGIRRLEPISSPLDPFLSSFLVALDALPTGYLASTNRVTVARALDWPIDFVDAILVSAQARGMVERDYRAHGRRRVIWIVSSRGRNWLDQGVRQPSPVTSSVMAESLTMVPAPI